MHLEVIKQMVGRPFGWSTDKNFLFKLVAQIEMHCNEISTNYTMPLWGIDEAKGFFISITIDVFEELGAYGHILLFQVVGW